MTAFEIFRGINRENAKVSSFKVYI